MIADRTCPTGKLVYTSWSHATWDAKQMRRKKSRGGNRERPYSCRTCSGIHVGQYDRRPRQMKEL